MNISDLLVVDLDLSRFILVAAVVVAMVVYSRFHLAVAGTLTGGYLVLLALTGSWATILAVIAVAFATRYLVRGLVTRLLPLPKRWILMAQVAVGVLLMAALVHLSGAFGPLVMPWGFSLILTTGAYITPGLMSYDLSQQGIVPTGVGLGLVVLGSLVATIPVLLLANVVDPQTSTRYVDVPGNLPVHLFWWAALAVVLFTAAVQLSFDLRTGGFIGALFLFEFLTPAAFLTVGAAALTTYGIVQVLERLIVWTPRQRFQVSLAVGAMVAWTSLYWASLTGWVPALEANAYALAPLLTVGLIASDMGRARSGIVRTLAGTGAAIAFLALVVATAQMGSPWGPMASVALVVIGPTVLLIPAVKRLRRSWRRAVEVGQEVAARA